MKNTFWMSVVVGLLVLACSKSDGRSTTPDNVIEKAVDDVGTSVEETPDRIEQTADEVEPTIDETPDRIGQTVREAEQTVDETMGSDEKGQGQQEKTADGQ